MVCWLVIRLVKLRLCLSFYFNPNYNPSHHLMMHTWQWLAADLWFLRFPPPIKQIATTDTQTLTIQIECWLPVHLVHHLNWRVYPLSTDIRPWQRFPVRVGFWIAFCCNNIWEPFCYMYYVSPVYRRGSSWSWPYGSWIYNYICNQYILPLTLWFRIPLSHNIMC